jgi:pyridoxine 5-phosphate synthase
MNLSVNLNKVALLRNSRGADNPAPLRAAQTCIDAGAAGLTLHLRQDRRHTRVEDVRVLCALCKQRGVEFNLEGDPREELIDLALEVKPAQFTLVPVTPGEITSDHGWNLPAQAPLIRPIIDRLKAAGIRVAIFMDPEPASMAHAADSGTDRVEIYTEPYAAAFGTDRQQFELERFRDAARAAAERGVGVNAGHDLNLHNLPLVAREIPEVLEVSIGHALLADALYVGLAEAVVRYLEAARGNEVPAPITR